MTGSDFDVDTDTDTDTDTGTDTDTDTDTNPHPTLADSIQLIGENAATIDAATLADIPVEERTVEIVCSTGDRYTDRWQGVPIPDLLETKAAAAASFPPSTTHLLIESRDGQRGCVAVESALEGLLAIGKDGQPLEEIAGYESRFVAPDVLGPRTVKDIARIEAATLEPGEDPEAYERLLQIEADEETTETDV
ncbi:molybdopterin-dependent oxidoreductase [Halobiforma nitratireducens]|uniref:Oxidoreductase molybdopterin binding protein n=1 Tax=Halobiforma nitratireducens JCM 10879 TaxID=1227454 RepID=M0M572_9EURY|nr:molybdopterin-dependent oxidoreductase [Halobiforma nitratireducens]EMA39500.1 oxidoreductase molybdopterin binding protein [Halobiforma nitratireducens JCM 10879]